MSTRMPQRTVADVPGCPQLFGDISMMADAKADIVQLPWWVFLSLLIAVAIVALVLWAVLRRGKERR